MIRTQISLTEDQKQRLDTMAAERAASMSELVRRAIDLVYPPTGDVDADVAAIRAAAGAWADRELDGERYVQHVRSGQRLAGR